MLNRCFRRQDGVCTGDGFRGRLHTDTAVATGFRRSGGS